MNVVSVLRMNAAHLVRRRSRWEAPSISLAGMRAPAATTGNILEPLSIGGLTLKSLLIGGLLTLSCLLLIEARPPAAAAAESSMRGKILFLRCASCHDISTTSSPKIGPSLKGVVGRQVASLEGYKYSPALKSQDFVWDAAHLDAWIKNPNAVAPGTAMAFAGIAEDADREAIISYLSNP
jgi:cytochrome c